MAKCNRWTGNVILTKCPYLVAPEVDKITISVKSTVPNQQIPKQSILTDVYFFDRKCLYFNKKQRNLRIDWWDYLWKLATLHSKVISYSELYATSHHIIFNVCKKKIIVCFVYGLAIYLCCLTTLKDNTVSAKKCPHTRRITYGQRVWNIGSDSNPVTYRWVIMHIICRVQFTEPIIRICPCPTRNPDLFDMWQRLTF